MCVFVETKHCVVYLPRLFASLLLLLHSVFCFVFTCCLLSPPLTVWFSIIISRGVKKVRHYQGYVFFILASLTLIYFIRLSSYTQAVIKPLFLSPKMELIQMKEVVLAAYNQSQTTILQYDNKTKQCINSAVWTFMCI